MKNKIFFTLNPAPLYFTYPFHLRQSSRTLRISDLLRPSRPESLVRNFFSSLIRLLDLPDDYCGIVFSSDLEFKSFLAESFYDSGSCILQHSNQADEFELLVRAKGYIYKPYPVNIHEPVTEIKTGRNNLPVYALWNNPHLGSTLPAKAMVDSISNHRDLFSHADLTSLLPGSPVSLKEIPSFSFSLNTSFGIPFSQVVWFISPGWFRKFRLKREKAVPSGRLIKLTNPYYSFDLPDPLFLDIASKVIEDLIAKGLKSINQETRYKFTVLEQAVNENPVFEFIVKEPANRSLTTIVLQYLGKSGKITDKFVESGYEVDYLLAEGNAQRIRISNFPVHSKEQFESLADRIILMK